MTTKHSGYETMTESLANGARVPLDELARAGAQWMLELALQVEVSNYVGYCAYPSAQVRRCGDGSARAWAS